MADAAENTTVKSEKVYGIDLGTTYSAIAFTNESGAPETIMNKEGLKTTPSVVCFETEGAAPIAGQTAKSKIGDEDCGDRVIDFVKIHMGEVLRDENNAPLKDENGKEIRWETKEVFGKKYLPQQISAFVLQKLIEDAKLAGHDVKKVVITCPAYFSAPQREATKQAGIIAGLDVVDIIDEPVAAALFYGLTKNTDDSASKDIIVYDLGGGTFDVTVLHIEQGNFAVKCTYGDHNLGGKNWDDALVSLIVQKVKESAGSEANPLDDTDFAGEVHGIVEKLKIDLSTADTAKFRLFYDGKQVKGSITREEFERETSGLLSNTQSMTQLAIDDAAKQGITQFDEFLLVGGSTKMPQVKRMVDAEFGKYCKKMPEPLDVDEAVAKGATKYGEIKQVQREFEQKLEEKKNEAKNGGTPIDENKLKEEAKNEVAKQRNVLPGEVEKNIATTIWKVSSKNYGIKLADAKDLNHLIVENLIFKQTRLPVEKGNTYSPQSAGQSSISLEVFENDVIGDDAKEPLELSQCTSVGKFTITDIPAGMPKDAEINVRFQLGDNGILRVHADSEFVGADGTKKKIDFNDELQVTGIMSEEEIAKARSQMTGLTSKS